MNSHISRTATATGSRLSLRMPGTSRELRKMHTLVNLRLGQFTRGRLNLIFRIMVAGLRRRSFDTNIPTGEFFDYYLGTLNLSVRNLRTFGARKSNGARTLHPAFKRFGQFWEDVPTKGKDMSNPPAKRLKSMRNQLHLNCVDAKALMDTLKSAWRFDLYMGDCPRKAKWADLLLNQSVFVAQQAGNKDTQVLAVYDRENFDQFCRTRGIVQGETEDVWEEYMEKLLGHTSERANYRMKHLVPGTGGGWDGISPSVSSDIGFTYFPNGSDGEDDDGVDDVSNDEDFRDDDDDDNVLPPFQSLYKHLNCHAEHLEHQRGCSNIRQDTGLANVEAPSGFSFVSNGDALRTSFKDYVTKRMVTGCAGNWSIQSANPSHQPPGGWLGTPGAGWQINDEGEQAVGEDGGWHMVLRERNARVADGAPERDGNGDVVGSVGGGVDQKIRPGGQPPRQCRRRGCGQFVNELQLSHGRRRGQRVDNA